MTETNEIEVLVADASHIGYVDEILDTINRAAKIRGTGIAKRSPEYVKQKMIERKAVIALCKGEFAGFSYIESWSNKAFVANSGLIVADKFRGHGLAKRIKRRIFRLSREMFPAAKIFSLNSLFKLLFHFAVANNINFKIQTIFDQFFRRIQAELWMFPLNKSSCPDNRILLFFI